MRTLLVANRGEIARRVFRTARDLGIRTVAVYSEADRESPHVDDADLAVPIGGRTSSESYLDAGKIIAAAKATGADAIHPGYGFLSENEAFARACALEGILFVGPSPDVIREMGLKDRAKEFAARAGVPVLPDAEIHGDDESAWLTAAEGVGYPLLVKATAGGGGKGMRRVNSPLELVGAVQAARREAGNSFGNATVFLERYLTRARHIEIQIFGDAHGNALHLGERECSVQRRHQKVLEEAPSPVVSPELRARMGETAVALARQLGYVGAGTVEYLLDGDTSEFFFLEMNTRLQVEHPVTEEVTGHDLVRLQLLVAEGGRLPLGQADVVTKGHAIEVRLYAEDPAHDYVPTPGPLFRYAHGEPSAGLRFEDGVRAPGEVSTFYDPMLAKVVAYGMTREVAAARLAAELERFEVHGTTTNRNFLVALLRDEDFLAGDTHTDFLDRHPQLLDPPSVVPQVVHLAAAVAVTTARRRQQTEMNLQAPPGFRVLPGAPHARASWQSHGGDRVEVTYQLDTASGDGMMTLNVDGTSVEFPVRRLELTGVRMTYAGVEHRCAVVVHPDGSVWVNSPGLQTGWRPLPRLPMPQDGTIAEGSVAALPGTVVAVLVNPGDRVHAGQQLAVVEAMKMEHAARAASDGIVETVHVSVGQYVDANAVLVTVGSGS